MTQANLPPYHYDCMIIGGGPAGYTAGIYAARSGLKTLLLEGASTVSQITITDLIENYPGIPDGIHGFDLMQLFKKQAIHFGLEISAADATSLKKNPDNSPIWETAAGNTIYKALSIIAATGAKWNKLGVPGEEKFAGKGVSYCATCDGPFYKNQHVVVVGGGDTAIQEALFLTHFAKKVTVIHRRDRLRAAAVLQQRAFAEKKIEFVWKAKLTEVLGTDLVTGVRITDVESGRITEILRKAFLSLSVEYPIPIFSAMSRNWIKTVILLRTIICEHPPLDCLPRGTAAPNNSDRWLRQRETVPMPCTAQNFTWTN